MTPLGDALLGFRKPETSYLPASKELRPPGQADLGSSALPSSGHSVPFLRDGSQSGWTLARGWPETHVPSILLTFANHHAVSGTGRTAGSQWAAVEGQKSPLNWRLANLEPSGQLLCGWRPGGGLICPGRYLGCRREVILEDSDVEDLIWLKAVGRGIQASSSQSQRRSAVQSRRPSRDWSEVLDEEASD